MPWAFCYKHLTPIIALILMLALSNLSISMTATVQLCYAALNLSLTILATLNRRKKLLLYSLDNYPTINHLCHFQY